MNLNLLTRAAVATAVFTVAAIVCGPVFAQEGQHHPLLAGHLAYKQNTLHIHANFPEALVVNEEAVLVLEVKDAKTHQAVELNEKIEVELWMPSMGHGSAPTQVEGAVDEHGQIVPGTFNVKNVYFIMGGVWEVRITLIGAQGARETKSFKVTLSGDHNGHH